MPDKHEKFEVIELLGNTALFTSTRLGQGGVPKGLYKYDLRHADDDGMTACEVSKFVMVNHYGSILTNKPIKMIHNGCTMFDGEKSMKFLNQYLTVNAYKEKYKQQEVKRNKNISR